MKLEQFQVAAIVVDKKLIYSNHLKTNKERFYNFFVKLLTQHSTKLNGANIKIDGSGDKAFKQELNSYLRKQLPKGAISKLKFEDSRKNNLIQLADMVAGAVYRAKRSDKRNTRWLDMLYQQGKIHVWDFK